MTTFQLAVKIEHARTAYAVAEECGEELDMLDAEQLLTELIDEYLTLTGKN